MTIYYKATQLDGMDFYTGTVDYAAHHAAGTPLPTLVHGTGRVCSDTVYHASDIESETLISGSWPCRLWEVTGDSVDSKGHKYGFRTLTVLREIEAWRTFGPNGQAVATLIERAAGITTDQAQAFRAARVAARDAARDAAWVAARDAAWVAAGDAAWVAAGDAAGALIVRDLISAEHFDLLTGPWCAVMGPLDSE